MNFIASPKRCKGSKKEGGLPKKTASILSTKMPFIPQFRRLLSELPHS